MADSLNAHINGLQALKPYAQYNKNKAINQLFLATQDIIKKNYIDYLESALKSVNIRGNNVGEYLEYFLLNFWGILRPLGRADSSSEKTARYDISLKYDETFARYDYVRPIDLPMLELSSFLIYLRFILNKEIETFTLDYLIYFIWEWSYKSLVFGQDIVIEFKECVVIKLANSALVNFFAEYRAQMNLPTQDLLRIETLETKRP